MYKKFPNCSISKINNIGRGTPDQLTRQAAETSATWDLYVGETITANHRPKATPSINLSISSIDKLLFPAIKEHGCGGGLGHMTVYG